MDEQKCIKIGKQTGKLYNNKSYRKKLIEIIRKTKQKYFQEKINQNKLDSSTLWKTVKDIDAAQNEINYINEIGCNKYQ